ncbi:hypothetical protein U9M48_035078 [Paspalum notatum var. saurae]|uniref:Uncharacterized protein n=1 Tax=Paspalum notatum var. saurae TaxID=547442 RepID=A0AAQ3UAZ3_PASNO
MPPPSRTLLLSYYAGRLPRTASFLSAHRRRKPHRPSLTLLPERAAPALLVAAVGGSRGGPPRPAPFYSSAPPAPRLLPPASPDLERGGGEETEVRDPPRPRDPAASSSLGRTLLLPAASSSGRGSTAGLKLHRRPQAPRPPLLLGMSTKPR